MFNFSNKDIRKLKILGFLSLLLVFIILLVYGVRYYFSNSIVSNWENISEDKNKEIHADCLILFYDYQNRASQFSYKLSKEKKINSAFSNLNSRKTFEALQEEESLNDFNVELYNSRLELFLFSGRQINPDIMELRRAFAGERFSAIKEIGIYTYIVVFDPLRNDSGVIEGVLVTSGLLDINYDIQARFFKNTGIKRLIYDKYHIDVQFEFTSLPSNNSYIDTTSGEFTSVNLKNINEQVIGRILIPNLDQSSYLLSVISKFNNLIGFFIFVLNLLLVYWVIAAVSKADSVFLKILLTSAALICSRYIWIYMNFPGHLLTEMGSEIFSPVHYASGIGYGMSKSLGELFITSLLILFISLYIVMHIIRFYRDESGKKHKMWVIVAVSSAAAVISTLVINYYGVIIQSLIFDSTIKFIDKTDIFSLDQPELVAVRLIILCFSSALIFVQVACALTATKFLNTHLFRSKFTRKNSSLIFYILLILVNLLVELMPMQIELALKMNLRILILVLSGLFTLYMQRQFSIVRDYRFVNIVNFSLVLLACAIFVPAILLNKITSLENKYLEKAAKEISQQSSDKISFLISSTLEDISDDTQIEADLKDKNKVSKLAFNIWAKSKFYEEDLNSAVFVLDTAKKLVSDFNINPGELLSDSVVSFSLQNISKKSDNEDLAEETETDEEPETLDFSSIMNTMQLESGGVMQNKEMKFFSAIMPLEKTDLKNSKFNKVIGYIIIAAGYDAKNFLTQSNLGIFKNFTRDNILNKLTSNPVITEFSESELVGSSNKDISKALVKSLDAFRESVKEKIDKSALRYDEFENEFYKSFYVLTTIRNANSISTEKIYIVSVKVNDFSLNTFFFFRYLLFIVLIYIVILSFYLIYKGFTYLLDTESVKFMKFGFREKLFGSFMLASVIPIVILAIYTREFVNEKNEDSSKNQLISDLRIVDQYVKNKLTAEALKPDKYGKKESGGTFVNLFDRGFSESDKNFNFYLKTKLAATTSEQLYKSDLLDTRISGNAYYNIVLLKKDYYSENQQIGDFTFIVGYKPIYDSYNNLLGIISTQTVFKQSEINQDLTESLVYILGPYFAAVILLVFIVNFLSYRISNPILKLQKATEQLSKGNIDVQVKSNSKDEIGELVKSFNRMIRELQRSRDELKKAEREGAWRDIARQVAHEIKNPLTPMKLAMQHLYYAYVHGSKDFKSIIQTTNKLIIEQVETLNRIATEFSNFAKLPSRNYELLNMNDVLSDVVKLMNTDNTINLKLVSLGSNDLVKADKDEIKRALINIIKNSMQAIDEKGSPVSG
ncbi:MAG: HAMP domain-containing protein, partial [Ignavibacteria bacterium]|nr:HAMP domain-containing protein [Ignavibacteria bacterium]